MAFPVSPTEGQTFTENNTVWIYSAVTDQWNRSVINPLNETTYIGSDGAPGGIGGNTQVIFNDNGSLASDAGLVYNKTTDALTAGSLRTTSLGTAAAPTFSFTGDPNTGIYSPGAYQLAVATNGVERVEFGTSEVVFNDDGTNYDFRIEGDTNASLVFADASTDRVGIGTSTPGSLLTVGPGTSSLGVVALFNTVSSSETGKILFRSNNNFNAGGGIASIYARDAGTVNQSRGELMFATSFDSAPIERLRITHTGLVGIGTTSPGQALEVLGTIYSQNNATSIVHFQAADTGAATDEKTWRIAQSQRAAKSIQLGVALNDASSVANAAITIVRSGATLDNIQFATGSGSERARIDVGGKLLLGTSTSRTIASSGENTRLQIESPNSGIAGFSIITNRGDNLGPVIYLGKSRGPSNGGTTIVADGDILGEIRFAGTDGTDIESMGARIIASVDGTPGVNDMPGKIAFLTSADGSASPTERLRITSAGVLQIAEAGNITVGTTTGTKIGTATTQKLGFYNATPVVQPTAVADATTAVDVITQLNALLAKLRTLGIIAT